MTVIRNEENKEFSYEFRIGEENHCTRRLAFIRRSTVTEENILHAREERELKAVFGDKLDIQSSVITQTEIQEPETKCGRGRPPGAINKKTLEKEAELARLQEKDEPLPQKRGRGRPLGAKNKKTLEREAAERAKKSETVPNPSN